ncbi:MAG: hypothetical protein GX181_00410 [Synergistaceae bacterium]|nr:hypothetical protein [Synergistota bacterium]NLM70405.1 hypothetical protein [Synergistaceae bacterium]
MSSHYGGKNLGYILVDGSGGVFRGAVLVTDFRGIPADFRYTDPIKPSRIEKILYGGALDVYLKEELILENIVGAVEVQPTLWICRDADLLESLSRTARAKAVLLAPTSRAPMDAVGDTEKQNDPGSYLVQADPMSAPLRISLPLSRSKEEEAKAVASILVEAASTMDLLEPFSRMSKALAALGEEQSGD